MSTILVQSGRRLIDLFAYLGGMASLLYDSLWWVTIGPFRRRGAIRRRESVFQAYRLGVASLGINALVIFFVGMILTFQSAYVLETFGVVEYVADMMSIAMFREMGPLITAMVMTGFGGAAIAAEIGTMVVSEEVLALETGALHPVRFLVVPRLLAAMYVMPIIYVVASYLGVLGGFTVAWAFLDIEPIRYFHRTTESLIARDVIAGVLKAEAFGVLITLIACHEGLRVTGGAEGVGRATTNSVVRSIVAIIVCDLIFTAIFYFL
ncbi:MAG TPA: ABC transporter permease [Planctomycetota bacterium]|nr:ABC transporter permease [Planctomycetota bacterium]